MVSRYRDPQNQIKKPSKQISTQSIGNLFHENNETQIKLSDLKSSKAITKKTGICSLHTTLGAMIVQQKIETKEKKNERKMITKQNQK